MAKTTFWVVIEPKFRSRYDHVLGEQKQFVDSIKVTGVTQRKPEGRRPVGSLVSKLTLDIPDAAFLPLMPQAVIVVPEDMVLANVPIEVEAQDPSSD